MGDPQWHLVLLGARWGDTVITHGERRPSVGGCAITRHKLPEILVVLHLPEIKSSTKSSLCVHKLVHVAFHISKIHRKLGHTCKQMSNGEQKLGGTKEQSLKVRLCRSTSSSQELGSNPNQARSHHGKAHIVRTSQTHHHMCFVGNRF